MCSRVITAICIGNGLRFQWNSVHINQNAVHSKTQISQNKAERIKITTHSFTKRQSGYFTDRLAMARLFNTFQKHSADSKLSTNTYLMSVAAVFQKL